MFGIDVSENNGQIDWNAVSSQCQFAIIRSSYGKSGIDSQFQTNASNAKSAGLIIGAYHYSYALDPDDAILEGLSCKEQIEESGLEFDLPIFFDMEDADGYKSRNGFDFSQDNITNICKNFINALAPLNAGVYASYDWLINKIAYQSLNCPIWCAAWGSQSPDDIQNLKIWQYSDNLIISGTVFDGDITIDQ